MVFFLNLIFFSLTFLATKHKENLLVIYFLSNSRTKSTKLNFQQAIGVVILSRRLSPFRLRIKFWVRFYYQKIRKQKMMQLNKVSLQTSLERNSSNFLYISFLGVNFENLTVEFHVPYVLNMHIKLNVIYYLINQPIFIQNFRSQKLEILTFVWWHSN